MSDAAEQVEEWADEVYEKLGKETTWAIAQVRCPEEGCPPVETILTDLNVKGPKPGNGVYKIFKPMNEVTKGDVEAALCGKGGGHAGGHGAATAEAMARATAKATVTVMATQRATAVAAAKATVTATAMVGGTATVKAMVISMMLHSPAAS
eukprot:CAMPEP_0179311774 /NCGR_PEP_ID=MMETSP0797-20121207/52874_1 /TAXON_ID=47934 /ORGANISM="Dinophysis acuminata, Strain DAEP01" /LENGTH=150 /DNA_ID=CAMNT_0021021587 /DNA_START=59 /DNA_END=512 /DNA_ORIENTATION=+